MMDFNNFMEYVQSEIRNYLGEEYKNVGVLVNSTLKNNDVCFTGMTIRKDNLPVSPKLYLEPYFYLYATGTALETVMERMAGNIRNAYASMPLNLSTEQFKQWEYVRNSIFPVLVNYERNRKMLESCPYTKLEDLAVIYRYFVSEGTDVVASALITNSLLDYWSIDTPVLHEQAMSNRVFEPDFLPLQSVIQQMGFTQEEEYEESFPYVITNKPRINGAAALLDRAHMEYVCRTMKSRKLYVLPSSVHECLVMPYDENVSVYDLQLLVRSANHEEVKAEEFLSDNVYVYDLNDYSLRIA